MRIDAVIFDFGGVFIESPYPMLDSIGAGMGLKPGDLSDIIFGSLFEDSDHPYHRLERGQISLLEARDQILERGRALYGVDVDIFEAFASMPPDVRQPMVARVRKLKRDGYPTAIITNNIREYADMWRAMLPVEELFDLVVDSSFEGIRKPNPAIFRLALQRLGGLAPEHTVFLDDCEGNVRGAASVGMRTIHVRDNIMEAIAELDALLG